MGFEIRIKLAVLFTSIILLSDSLSGHNLSEDLRRRAYIDSLGILHTGEYSYFQTPQGEVYDLRLIKARDRDILNRLAPLQIDPFEPCIRMRVQGWLQGKKDSSGRNLLTVARISNASLVRCPVAKDLPKTVK